MFKSAFTAIGKDFPEHFSTLEREAARYMALNNTVVLSVRCWGRRATLAALAAAGVVAGTIGVVAAFAGGSLSRPVFLRPRQPAVERVAMALAASGRKVSNV